MVVGSCTSIDLVYDEVYTEEPEGPASQRYFERPDNHFREYVGRKLNATHKLSQTADGNEDRCWSCGHCCYASINGNDFTHPCTNNVTRIRISEQDMILCGRYRQFFKNCKKAFMCCFLGGTASAGRWHQQPELDALVASLATMAQEEGWIVLSDESYWSAMSN